MQMTPIDPISPSTEIKHEDGYIKLAFPGKQDQQAQVSDYILEQKMLPFDLIQQEVDWFYK
jgi:hypothetical protein